MRVQLARDLRRSMTEAERVLWSRLRRRQVLGCRFRRQVVLGSYIVDFGCHEKRLVIEVDGAQHADQAEYDSQRTTWLEDQGFTVLRFWNHEILTQTEAVLAAIETALKS